MDDLHNLRWFALGAAAVSDKSRKALLALGRKLFEGVEEREIVSYLDGKTELQPLLRVLHLGGDTLAGAVFDALKKRRDEMQAERAERQRKFAGEVADRARLMQPAEFTAWLLANLPEGE